MPSYYDVSSFEFACKYSSDIYRFGIGTLGGVKPAAVVAGVTQAVLILYDDVYTPLLESKRSLIFIILHRLT